jgi:hypothetical protein
MVAPLELFDTMVLPVVMYGCEVWGFEKNNILESFCLQFYKILLGLKKSTPTCILYAELGCYPVDAGAWPQIRKAQLKRYHKLLDKMS